MKTPHLYRTLILGSLLFIAMQEADATVIFQTGNQQYTNVNIAADTNALSIIGDIKNTGLQMTFENMIGPDGQTKVAMHGQHGVAFVESYADSLPGATNTGFSSLTLMAQAGYGFTAGDFALDELTGGSNPGSVTFNGIDQFGNPNTSIFSMRVNGQNPYNFYTLNGEIVTSLVITAPLTSLLQDIKQVSVNVAPIPEPATLASVGLGLALLRWSRRRDEEALSPVQAGYPMVV